jgi:predicted site-specific integrase-resolvase
MRDAHLTLSPRFLTIRQACQELQICRNTLLGLINDGIVNAVNLKRPGGRYDILRIDLAKVGSELSIKEKIKLHQIEQRLGQLL